MSYGWTARTDAAAVKSCRSAVVQNHPLLTRTAVTATSVGAGRAKPKGEKVSNK